MSWGALAGAGGGLLGSVGSFFSQREAAEQAWKRQKKVLQNQVQWRVADLKAAGINPILAASAGLGGGGGASVGMAQSPDFAGAITKGAGVGAEASKVSSAKSLLKQQAETQRYQQESLVAQALSYDANASKAEADARISRAQAAEYEAKAEVWTNPESRKILQDRYMMDFLRNPYVAGAVGAKGIVDMFKGEKDSKPFSEMGEIKAIREDMGRAIKKKATEGWRWYLDKKGDGPR